MFFTKRITSFFLLFIRLCFLCVIANQARHGERPVQMESSRRRSRGAYGGYQPSNYEFIVATMISDHCVLTKKTYGYGGITGLVGKCRYYGLIFLYPV